MIHISGSASSAEPETLPKPQILNLNHNSETPETRDQNSNGKGAWGYTSVRPLDTVDTPASASARSWV
jgi:hypothetical protein